MIGKIHYVWLGGKPLPANVGSCIRSWKRFCPDWEIVRWDENSFPVDEFRWTREALASGKFAFAADFIRLYALKTAGVYLDTDVEIVRPIEGTLGAGFVCGVQNLLHTVGRAQKINDDGVDELTGRRCEGFGMQTGFLYSDPGHPFVSHCLEMIYDDGRRSYEPLIIDAALIWALKDFDPAFRFSDQTQRLGDDTLVWNSRVYTMRDFVTSDSVAIHWYDQSWMNYDTLPEKLRRFIRHRLYFLIRRKPGMPFDGHFQ